MVYAGTHITLWIHGNCQSNLYQFFFTSKRQHTIYATPERKRGYNALRFTDVLEPCGHLPSPSGLRMSSQLLKLAALVLIASWLAQPAEASRAARRRPVSRPASLDVVPSAEVDARVVPIGPAWQRALRERPDVPLYLDDGSHPTAAGAYLAACVFTAALFDRRPTGWSVSDALGIERETATTLQEVAVEACSATVTSS